MTRFKVFFCKVDGQEEVTLPVSHCLSATSLADATEEALALPRPVEANFVKIQDEDRGIVVSRIGLNFDI